MSCSIHVFDPLSVYLPGSIFLVFLQGAFEEQEVTPFHVAFFADAIVCAIKRWLLNINPDAPERFVDQLKSCVYLSADKVYHNMQSDE